MLSRELALRIFEAFSIERWNDLVRPFEIIEMDKAAERMVLAYIIGKYEEDRGAKIDWEWMMYASLFDLLKKIALCDIKSPVIRKIRSEYPQEYIRLNEWVLGQFRPIIGDDDLFRRFSRYIHQSAKDRTETQKKTARVFRAAHKLSTLRELQLIAPVNERQRFERIEKELFSDLQAYLDLRGLQLLLTRQKPFDFLLTIEQLRFQTRWNQTPRVPRTSVLGHCYFVAVMTFLLSRENSGFPPCPRRLYNNFFCGLFHDLPEAVTRDIISPVKQATDGLPSIVKRIEDEIVCAELLPLMEPFYAGELMYFTNDEFENRVQVGSEGAVETKCVSFEELNAVYNSDSYSPVDGKLVRLADHLSAFIEADSSIAYGITSAHLREGRNNLLSSYPDGTIINGVDAAALFKAVAR